MENDIHLIVQGCKQGKRSSQRALYDLYAPKVLGRLNTQLNDLTKANEVCFEVLVRMYLQIEEVESEMFEEWLIQLINKILNEYEMVTD